MSINTETQGKSKLYIEILKWLIVTVLLTIAIVGNYYYSEYRLLPRAFVVVVIIAIAGIIALMTTKGKYIISFTREANIEIRKVIWPSYQETFYTTLIIAIVTAVMSLILWGLDNILVRIVSFIINLRF